MKFLKKIMMSVNMLKNSSNNECIVKGHFRHPKNFFLLLLGFNTQKAKIG